MLDWRVQHEWFWHLITLPQSPQLPAKQPPLSLQFAPASSHLSPTAIQNHSISYQSIHLLLLQHYEPTVPSIYTTDLTIDNWPHPIIHLHSSNGLLRIRYPSVRIVVASNSQDALINYCHPMVIEGTHFLLYIVAWITVGALDVLSNKMNWLRCLPHCSKSSACSNRPLITPMPPLRPRMIIVMYRPVGCCVLMPTSTSNMQNSMYTTSTAHNIWPNCH